MSEEKTLNAVQSLTDDAPPKELTNEEKIAAAKAKVAERKRQQELAKQNETQTETQTQTDQTKEEKIAAAKAKAEELRKQREAAGEQPATEMTKEEKIAAAKAKAEALKKERESKVAATEEPETPSKHQPQLDAMTKALTQALGESSVISATINRRSKEVPTIEVAPEHYYKAIKLLKTDAEFAFDSMHELHGTDFMTHLEVFVYLFSFSKKYTAAIKVKVDREEAVIPSITPLYPGADWPERETFDLLGITFTNHPNMTRIMLPDDWIGYPLRKDYKQHDVEV
ncbi:MAG: NADH-quinone oxidoreductase subunit C [Bacilli bacterium]